MAITFKIKVVKIRLNSVPAGTKTTLLEDAEASGALTAYIERLPNAGEIVSAFPDPSNPNYLVAVIRAPKSFL